MIAILTLLLVIGVQSPPTGRPGGWLIDDDLPSDARRIAPGAATKLRLTISDKGKVTGCEVVESVGFASLDKFACRQMTRAPRFNPATDAGGKPVQGSIEFRYHFSYAPPDWAGH